MLKLTIPQQPYWLDLGLGVKVKVKPCTSAIFYQGRAIMNQRLQQLGEDFQERKKVGAELTDLPDLEQSNVREGLAEQYLTLGLGLVSITEWQGVLTRDGKTAAPVTSATIEELFGHYWLVAETFRQKYTGLQELLAAEKNAYGLASDGTTVTGPATPATTVGDTARKLAPTATIVQKPKKAGKLGMSAAN